MHSSKTIKTRLQVSVFTALALLASVAMLRGQATLGNALDATNLVWTTGGTGGVEWYYEAGGLGDNTFDGVDGAHSGQIGDNGETWIQTTVVGPGTVSFWWQAYSEPGHDWLEFYVGGTWQARICGGGDDWASWPSGWQYCSFPVPAGTSVLKWRYAKDASSTGGTLDYAEVDQVRYVTSPPPALEQALNTVEVLWSSSGSAYDNGWFAQTNVTHDGQWAAQSGAIWHSQTNWLQATVCGVTNVSFWWAVSSQANKDFLEFYTNGVLARQISGEVSWQSNFFRLPLATNVLTWLYRKNESVTAGLDCGWLDQVTFSTPINKTDTTTALAASGNPSVFGQAVTFTATVTSIPPGSGTPTGTVTFKDGATTLGTAGLSAGQATFTTASLSVAPHSITATYGGDIFFKISDSTASPLTHVVNPASTTTTVDSSANPSVFGQSVSFTATVNAVAPGAGTPTGTVQFSIDGFASGPPVTLSGGTATSEAMASLAVAGHTVTAVYSGDTSFAGSDNTSSPLAQTVNAASTTTTVASSANPSVFGQSVTVTATVAAVSPGSGAPGGTVTFKDGAATLGTGTLSAGSATFTTSALIAATHPITAVYGGDSRFNPSTSSTLAQTVNKDATTTALASSANPSVFSQPVTFTASVTANAPGSGTPAGTVTFKDGATALATTALSSGQATFTTSTLSIAAHSITAVYDGDANFTTSTSSPVLTQTVNRDSTAVTLSSSTNPIVFGQAVILTATVAAVPPGSGTPTGSVTFKDGTNSLGTKTLVSGQVSYTNTALTAGAHLVSAVYSGDGTFNTNTSPAVTQAVNQADTATTVSSSANPSVFGQPVTFTATVSAVAPGSGTPSGTVTFKDGAATLGTGTLSAGLATLSTSVLSVASHPITAVYGGDSNFKGSDNSSSPLTQTVSRANSMTAVSSAVNPAVFGQSVTFTATVSAVAPGAGTRTGMVQFSIDGSPAGSPVSLSGGTATSGAISTLSVAGHTVTAAYSGDANFNASDTAASPLIQTVNKASTTTAVAASANPAVAGQPVIFTATVSAGAPGAGTPGGTVTFKNGATSLGTATLSSGQATLTNSSLTAASHSITAVYGGDGSFNTSTSATLTQTVNQAGTTTAVASSQNPSVFGQSVTFTATVSATAPGSGTPSGTVTFKDGTTSLATRTLSGGQATYSSAGLSAAAHSVTAVYNGDGNFNTSTSSPLTQTVNKAGTSTAVTASGNPSVFGQAVTFTATVTVTAPGSGTPTGTVTFKDGATTLGTGSLSAGQAALTTASLPAASHSITATYDGDNSFNISGTTASPLTQVVNPAGTTTSVASSANPSVFGQPVSFTATVNAVAPGAGTPTGTVQFKTNGVNFGSAVTLANGSAASPALSSLAVGTLAVTAIYGGDSNFKSSDNAAAPLAQTVNKAATTTAIASSKNPSSTGDPVTWTATVSASAPGAGTPSGTVQFIIDGTSFDGPVTLSGGIGTSLAMATLAPGSHTITAVYSGDGSFNNSTSADFTQTVNTSPVTPATGGSAISADTTGGAYTTLTGPVYTEASPGAVGTGTIILNAPAGFIFDTGGAAPTVRITGGAKSSKNINGAASGTALALTSVTDTQLTLTVTVSSAIGGTPNTLTWQNVRVRPTAGAPLAAGDITKTGTASMSGVANGANFGFLAETAGAASRLAVHTPPSATATAGMAFAQQPAVQIQDQFGNARTFANRSVDNSTVVSAGRGAGTGTLQGTLTATAINGLATFSNLSYDRAETITIQFTSGGLTSATSGDVVVSPAAADRLVFTTQPGSATYGSALSPQPVVKSRDAFGNDSTVGLAANQPVTLSLSAGTGLLQGTTSLDIGTSAGNGTVAYSGLQVSAVGTGKQLTAAATGLASAVSSSFTINSATVPAVIHALVRQPDGTMEIRASGIPDKIYLVQACEKLGGSWATIGAKFANADGLIVFLDRNAANYASRFYRIVAAEAVDIPPVIHTLAPQPDGNMEIIASGIPDKPYLIQASGNLGAWATIGTNSADADGRFVFLDQNATNYTSRFYRLAVP